MMIYHIHKQLLEALKKNLHSNNFTSCEVGFFYKYNNDYKNYILYMDKDSISFCPKKYFDLASLTKVIVTVPCIWSLLSEKKILMSTKIVDIYPEYFCFCKNNTTISDLVNHISGLSPHKNYSFLLDTCIKDKFKFVENNILEELFKKEGKKVLQYSDLGYILLGRIIEKISGKKINEYWMNKIFIPLKLNKFCFPSIKDVSFIDFVSTGICDRTGESLQGVVNDANCRLLGGVCGHAGLFGNSYSLLDFLQKILFLYKRKLVINPLRNSILKENIDKNIKSRRFGFDTPAKEKSSCGKYFSDLTIGHLGFTGTSVWLDLKREAGVVLLTNRTYKGDKKNIKEIQLLRPQIHDIIMKKIPCK